LRGGLRVATTRQRERRSPLLGRLLGDRLRLRARADSPRHAAAIVIDEEIPIRTLQPYDYAPCPHWLLPRRTGSIYPGDPVYRQRNQNATRFRDACYIPINKWISVTILVMVWALMEPNLIGRALKRWATL